MNERKRKNIIIMVLCSFMVLMGVGYALLAQTLTINTTATINSTWDIRITNVEVANTVGYATDTTPANNIASDGHSATVTADLSAPGDTITYTVTVHNFGTIAGMYDVSTQNLIVPGVGQPSGIVTATTDVATSDTLKYLAPKTGEGTFNVTLKFEDLDKLPDVKEYSFTIAPNFVQAGSNGGSVTPSNPESNFTPEAQYTIANDGTLIKYNYDYGTDVTLPASFDGKNITKIAMGTFNTYNVALVARSDGKFDAIGFCNTEEEFNSFVSYLESSPYSSIVNEVFDASYSFNTIPDTWVYYDGNNLTLSGDGGTRPYEFSSQITSLDLSNATYLTEIGKNALKNATSLTSLNLGNTVSVIGPHAFVESGLTTVTIPESVTTIEYGAFVSLNDTLETYKIDGDISRFDDTSSSWFIDRFRYATRID